jgi:hypothetical protein
VSDCDSSGGVYIGASLRRCVRSHMFTDLASNGRHVASYHRPSAAEPTTETVKIETPAVSVHRRLVLADFELALWLRKDST